jgi:hypothetical protein
MLAWRLKEAVFSFLAAKFLSWRLFVRIGIIALEGPFRLIGVVGGMALLTLW